MSHYHNLQKNFGQEGVTYSCLVEESHNFHAQSFHLISTIYSFKSFVLCLKQVTWSCKYSTLFVHHLNNTNNTENLIKFQTIF